MELAEQLGVPLVTALHGYDVTVSDRAIGATRLGREYLHGRSGLQKKGALFLSCSAYVRKRGLEMGFRRTAPSFTRLEWTWNASSRLHLAAGKDCAICRTAGGEEGLRQPDRGHGRSAAPQSGGRTGGDRRRAFAPAIRSEGCRTGRAVPLLRRPVLHRGAGMDGAGGVFCVPSVVAASGDAEGFGMVFIEAQAMGLPVVSTRSGGIPEAVKDGETGLLVSERNPRALAEAILQLMQDEELWQRFSLAGRRHVVEHFNLAAANRASRRCFRAVAGRFSTTLSDTKAQRDRGNQPRFCPSRSRQRPGRRFYQPELDGLRFYAFLGVFVCHRLPYEAAFYRRFHLPMPWLWGAVAKSGASGVDLFFALSAFLITSTPAARAAGDRRHFAPLFYIRRILRIWPLYFLVIALAVVLAHTVAGPNPSLVLRCRLPAVRRQLGARGLRPAGVGLLSFVDGLDRRAVLPDMADADEDARASRHDRRRRRYFFAGDRKPRRLYAGRLERGLSSITAASRAVTRWRWVFYWRCSRIVCPSLRGACVGCCWPPESPDGSPPRHG